MLAAGYMLLGFVQLQRAQTMAEELAASRGHQITKHVVKPTLANLVLWRSVYLFENRFYVDAIRLGVFAENKVFEGESAEKFNLIKDLPNLEQSSVLLKDIQRFTSFSNGYVAFDSTQKNVLGDLRYSMLPVSVKPLWGIVINKDKPQVHANYHFFRDTSPQVRKAFVNMLFLRDTKE